MLASLMGFVSGFLAKLLAQIVSDWRKDAALREAGAAEANLQTAQETIDAQKRMAEANARPRSADIAAGRLSDGSA